MPIMDKKLIETYLYIIISIALAILIIIKTITHVLARFFDILSGK
jgi:hypothetical protein